MRTGFGPRSNKALTLPICEGGATASRRKWLDPAPGQEDVMAKRQYSDVRGVAKAERAHERQVKKEEKLAKRRKARGPQPEPETRAGKGAGEVGEG